MTTLKTGILVLLVTLIGATLSACGSGFEMQTASLNYEQLSYHENSEKAQVTSRPVFVLPMTSGPLVNKTEFKPRSITWTYAINNFGPGYKVVVYATAVAGNPGSPKAARVEYPAVSGSAGRAKGYSGKVIANLDELEAWSSITFIAYVYDDQNFVADRLEESVLLVYGSGSAPKKHD